MTDTAKWYLGDLSTLLIEDAREIYAKVRGDNNVTDFERGQLHAYYCVLSLMEEQAKSFGIGKEDLGFGSFSSDDLLK